MPATVTVHVGAQGTERVPDTVFGSFLEPIGNSINNGVVAEILVNGSLESGLWNHTNLENMFRDQPELIDSTNQTGIPLPWQPLDPAAGNRFELHVGDAANSWQSLEIMGTPHQQAGIMQKVYLPGAARAAATRFALCEARERAIGTDGAVSRSGDRKDTGGIACGCAGGGVDEIHDHAAAESRSGAALAGSRFRVLLLKESSRADVDEISLLPEDAIGIFDPDEVAMAKAMHVTELRLGGNFSSYYHWKDGIGPADKRVTMENIAWGIPEYNKLRDR